MPSPRTEIHFSKKKLTLLLLGCLAFVSIGTWFIIDPPEDNTFHGIPIPMKVLGIFAVLFFGVIGIYCFKRLFYNEPAIIIEDLGMEDRSSLFSGGFILWNEIRSVSVMQIKRQRVIMIQLDNPEKYIQSQSNAFKRMMLRLNFKGFKAHLSISANSLDISTDELYRILNSKIRQKTT